MAKLLCILFACVISFGANPTAFGFSGHLFEQSTVSNQKEPAGTTLTEDQRALAAGSRRVIVRTGISESYFDRHFKLVRVVNQPGDRRVIWKYSINGYETIVSDVLGFYSESGKRIDVHSVATTLQKTTEIRRTISKSSANQIMRRCIGTFAYPSVEYRWSGSGTARLVMVAEAVRKNAKEPTGKPPEPEVRTTNSQDNDIDVIRRKKKRDTTTPVFGSVDLQSAKCVKGIGQAGAPTP